MAPNILLVRFSSIGDIVLTTPVVRAIRARHPAARITYVVREDFADLLRHNPRIDRLITWPHREPLRPLAQQLRQEEWTHRIDLHGSLRSQQLRHLVDEAFLLFALKQLQKYRMMQKRFLKMHLALPGLMN